ncbi:putative leader peptide [Streptomyces telluris]|uniref:putative leader peptide n=1 Tax=Streptomyces telluris TaxID=2720021 RepID=UPI0035D43379
MIVIPLPSPGPPLTLRTANRQCDVVWPGPFLHGRAHVDLLRTASACCPGA